MGKLYMGPNSPGPFLTRHGRYGNASFPSLCILKMQARSLDQTSWGVANDGSDEDAADDQMMLRQRLSD